ncbi:HAD family phosphatase [Pseudoalteromonas luteoviolacea]|uniref:HAD family hydrolase n=1 Tax=Pseudoalteromonas luteoviolacea TaxID=43657 RepID=UPI001F374C5B|nr:HAD family phosphatase [Pseudoalteromonas luteoviolacea]MCF6440196.1 HAD family phosphatase [Pseudoalteromonas luteoviolacea]
MGLQAILFDFDGTLVDSETLHYTSWCKVLSPFNIFISESEFCDEFSGVPTVKTGHILQQRYNLPYSGDELATLKNTQFVETAATEKPKLMPHAMDVLSLCAQHYKLALVTGSTRAEAFPVLTHYQLREFFDYIVCKDDVTNPKPHPEPYCLAMAKLNISAQEAIAVEDSQTGLASATAAGVKTVVISHLHSAGQDFTKAAWRSDSLEAMWQQIVKPS